MRLAVLDVGSNTVHLLVVDAHPGATPIPATSVRTELRLAQHLEDDGSISPEGADALVRFVSDSLSVAEDHGAENVLAFATSAIREAPNGEAVLDRVRSETDVELSALSGDDEARLTFLAVRRWFGWSAGKILLFDIGGGSLELAVGADEVPDVALSLPLGAGRLTHDRLPGDPPEPDVIASVRKFVHAEIGKKAHEVTRVGSPDWVAASSKTFRSLARIAGAAPRADGIYTPRRLTKNALKDIVPKLSVMKATEREQLPAVSSARAGQLLAGAIVAEAAMDVFGVDSLAISPWALREGVILRKLDLLDPLDDR